MGLALQTMQCFLPVHLQFRSRIREMTRSSKSHTRCRLLSKLVQTRLLMCRFLSGCFRFRSLKRSLCQLPNVVWFSSTLYPVLRIFASVSASSCAFPFSMYSTWTAGGGIMALNRGSGSGSGSGNCRRQPSASFYRVSHAFVSLRQGVHCQRVVFQQAYCQCQFVWHVVWHK